MSTTQYITSVIKIKTDVYVFGIAVSDYLESRKKLERAIKSYTIHTKKYLTYWI